MLVRRFRGRGARRECQIRFLGFKGSSWAAKKGAGATPELAQSLLPTVRRSRSERWRRAHGIGPRKPAQRPWLAEGISRSTWYRWRRQARELAARQVAVAAFDCAVARTDALTTQLARDLERCAAIHAVMARELASQAYNP